MSLDTYPHYAPTYRYGVVIGGANYVAADVYDLAPDEVYFVQTLADARELVSRAAREGRPYAENGNGEIGLHTPVYGEEGDYALVIPVQRNHPDFSEVLDEPGDRARHAYSWLSKNGPTHVFEFGPHGGLRSERIAL